MICLDITLIKRTDSFFFVTEFETRKNGVICDDPVILVQHVWPFVHCATTARQCSQGMLVADFTPNFIGAYDVTI